MIKKLRHDNVGDVEISTVELKATFQQHVEYVERLKKGAMAEHVALLDQLLNELKKLRTGIEKIDVWGFETMVLGGPLSGMRFKANSEMEAISNHELVKALVEAS